MAQELAAYSGLTRAVALIQLIIKDAKTPFGCVAMLEQGERKTIKDLTSADEISDYLEKEEVNTVLFYVNLNDKKAVEGLMKIKYIPRYVKTIFFKLTVSYDENVEPALEDVLQWTRRNDASCILLDQAFSGASSFAEQRKASEEFVSKVKTKIPIMNRIKFINGENTSAMDMMKFEQAILENTIQLYENEINVIELLLRMPCLSQETAEWGVLDEKIKASKVARTVHCFIEAGKETVRDVTWLEKFFDNFRVQSQFILSQQIASVKNTRINQINCIIKENTNARVLNFVDGNFDIVGTFDECLTTLKNQKDSPNLQKIIVVKVKTDGNPIDMSADEAKQFLDVIEPMVQMFKGVSLVELNCPDWKNSEEGKKVEEAIKGRGEIQMIEKFLTIMVKMILELNQRNSLGILYITEPQLILTFRDVLPVLPIVLAVGVRANLLRVLEQNGQKFICYVGPTPSAPPTTL